MDRKMMKGSEGNLDYMVIMEDTQEPEKGLAVGLKPLLVFTPFGTKIGGRIRVSQNMTEETMMTIGVGKVASEAFPAVPFSNSNNVRASAVIGTSAPPLVLPGITAKIVRETLDNSKVVESIVDTILKDLFIEGRFTKTVEREEIIAYFTENYHAEINKLFPCALDDTVPSDGPKGEVITFPGMKKPPVLH